MRVKMFALARDTGNEKTHPALKKLEEYHFNPIRMRLSMRCFAFFLLGAVASLAVVSWARADWSPELCSPYAEIDTSSGEYRISNNVGSEPTATQCIAARNVSGEIRAGFRLTHSHERTPYPTFPSIVCGRHPWSSEPTGCLQEAVQLSSIVALTSNFSVGGAEKAVGECNAAYDLWLLPDTQQDHVGSPIGGVEIMIWPWSEEMRPGGEKVGSVRLRERVDGTWQRVPYDVYHAAEWGEGWRYVAFVRQEQRPEGFAAINLKDPLLYCQKQGWCQASDQLITVEAGFEIYEGCKGLTTRAFSVHLR